MKKRVLQLIGSFHQGGSERQAIALSRLLKNEGSLDVFAATLNRDGILRGEVESIGLPEIPEFPLTSFYDMNFIRQVRQFARYLTENEIDILHTHDFYTNVFGMAAARLTGTTARIASKRETGGMRSPSQDLIEKTAFRIAKAVVVNSSAVRGYLTERGIPSTKMHLIYNGLDLQRFDCDESDIANFLDQHHLPSGGSVKLITLVANLRHGVKNVPMLLRAARKIVAAHRDVHFVIAGEGELLPHLREMAVSMEIDANVHFIGRCTDIPGLLAASYSCVLTSTAEGFSNSIIEYMAAGKPVVATNVGGASEAIADGKSGYLVESDDDEALAQRLIELIADEERSTAFGAEGRRLATTKFSADAQLRTTLDLYNSLLR